MAVKISLDLLPVPSNVFIDANIFPYHILKRPQLFPSCEDFLMRIEEGEYNGFTSTMVLNEVLHKLVLAETIKSYRLRSERDAIKLLKEKPERISGLSQVWKSYSASGNILSLFATLAGQSWIKRSFSQKGMVFSSLMRLIWRR